MEFRAECRKELNRVLLQIRVAGVETEDYQSRMLRENTLNGLVSFRVYGEGEETIYEYDITGMVSLQSYYKKRKMSYKDMKMFLVKIQKVISEAEDYLLNPNRILLDPEYIYINEKQCVFCYFPKGDEEIHDSFHRLMDSFVKWTDYQDIPSVRAAFLLHKETMEENYSLQGVSSKLDALIRQEAAEAKKAVEKPPVSITKATTAVNTEPNSVGNRGNNIDTPKNDTQKVDAQNEMARKKSEVYHVREDWVNGNNNTMMEEKKGFWTPVKKLLSKNKKPKWGEWDSLDTDNDRY